MNKLFWVVIIVLMITCLGVSAELDPTDYDIYDPMELATTGYNASLWNAYGGGATQSSTQYMEGSYSAKINTGIDDGIGTKANLIDNTTDFTVEFFIYSGQSDTRNPYVYLMEGDPYHALVLGDNADDFGVGVWKKVQAEFYLNGSQKVYINDVWEEGANYGTFSSSGNYIKIKHLDGSKTSYVDLFRVWSGNIADDPNITVQISSLNLSSSFPVENSSFNSGNINFNLTVNSTYDFNCSLYLNDTLDTTNEYSSGTNVVVDFNKTFTEGNYNYFVGCVNGVNETNSSQINFFVDDTNPSDSWSVPATDNSTVVILPNQENLTTSITISDDNLYSYYLNITDLTTNTIFYSFSNTSLTGLTSTTIIENLNFSNYTGVMEATLKVCDGHTKNYISDFSVTKSSNSLQFDDVYLSTIGSINTDYTKLKDRYSFSFTFLKEREEIEINVPSNCKYIGDKTEYLGHYVCGGKWLDFEGDYEEIELEPNKIKIKSSYPRKVWTFNSIGELNCITDVKSFFVTNETIDYENNLLSTQSNLHQLNITYNSSYITSIAGTLTYNNVEYSVTGATSGNNYQFLKSVNAPSVTTETNVTFWWNYTINGVNYQTAEYNHTVIPPAIDDCSTYTTRWINFTLLDELNDTILNGSIDYIFEYTFGSYTGTYNGSSSKNDVSFDFCMNPAYANFTTDITLQYSVTGYDTRDYVSNNFVVDNTTEQIILYSLFSGISTEITIHIVDDSDNDLENVFIEAYRWDITTDTDKLVETEYTDSDGNAKFDLKTGSEYYSFKFYQDGVLQKSTTRFKLFATQYEYVLSQAETIKLSEWLLIKNSITTSLDYDNETNLATYTWDYSGSLGESFCLLVTSTNTTRYGYECSTNTTGSLTWLNPDTTVDYIALGSVITTSGYTFNLERKDIHNENWRNFGTETLPIALIVLLTIGLLGITTGSNTVIVSTTLGVIVLTLFGIIPLGTGWLIPIVIITIVTLFIINRRVS